MSLAYLASNVDPRRHQVRIIDCSLADASADSDFFTKALTDIRPHVVGVSCWSVVYPEGLSLLRQAKAVLPGTVTIMGGAHATLNAGAVMANSHVDYVLRGEAELSFAQWLDRLAGSKEGWAGISGLSFRADGSEVVHNPIEFVQNLDQIQEPDYSAIHLPEYWRRGYRYVSAGKRQALIWVTRGCPHRCEFCSSPLLNGRRLRHHSVDYIVQSIERLYRQSHCRGINIIDDGFATDPSFAKELCRRIAGLGLSDLWVGTPNGIRANRLDFELLTLMKKAGWKNVVIAPESGSARTLNSMRKDLEVDLAPQKVREIQRAGLRAIGFFMVGYPGETPEDVEATVKLIRACRLDFFSIFSFQPLPGTPVFERLREEGAIPADFIPGDYSTTRSKYVPDGLRGFNLFRLRWQEYLRLVLTHPSSLSTIAQNYSPREIVERTMANFGGLFRRFTRSSQRR